MNKPGWLRKLLVDRVDLVPEGANPGAHVALFKSKDPTPASRLTKYIGDPASLDGYIEAIRNAWRSDNPEREGVWNYVEMVYDDHVIVCEGEDTYRVAYMVSGGEVTFGPRVAVTPEVTFTEKAGDTEYPATPTIIPSNTSQEEPVSEINRDELPEDVRKAIEDLESQLSDAKGTADKVEELDKSLAEATDRIAAFEAEKAEFDAATQESVVKIDKSQLPDEVVKALDEREALAERVAKMETEARRSEFVAKAKADLDSLTEPDAIGLALMNVTDHCDEATAQTLERTLKAANAAIAKGNLFAELGGNASQRDAESEIAKMAEDRVAKGLNVNMGDAIEAVVRSNPDLAREAL